MNGFVFFKKVGTLISVYIWMSMTYYAQADIEDISLGDWSGDGLANLSFPMTIIRELGFRTGKSPNYITQITINGKSYGGDDGFDADSIKLDEDEHFNEYEYQISPSRVLNYVSFCTNKSRCVKGGSKQNDSKRASYAMGERVVAIGGRVSRNVDKLVLLTDPDNPLSLVKAVNATFILDVTPSSEEIIEYLSADAKMKESYLNTIWSTGFSEVEYLAKMAVNMDNSSLEIKYPERWRMEKALRDDLGKENTRKHLIPEKHVGVKFALGEILKQTQVFPEERHWIFPTSGTWYSVVNASDISRLFGCYDLRHKKWFGDMYVVAPIYEDYFPDSKKYKKEKFGFVYYDDKNE